MSELTTPGSPGSQYNIPGPLEAEYATPRSSQTEHNTPQRPQSEYSSPGSPESEDTIPASFESEVTRPDPTESERATPDSSRDIVYVVTYPHPLEHADGDSCRPTERERSTMILFLNWTEADLTAQEGDPGTASLIDTIQAIRRYLASSQVHAEGYFKNYLTRNRTAWPLRRISLQVHSTMVDEENSLFGLSEQRDLFSAFNRINRGLYGDHEFRWPTAHEMAEAQREAEKLGACNPQVHTSQGAPEDASTSWERPGIYIRVV